MSFVEKLEGLAIEDFIPPGNYECAGAEHWLLKMRVLSGNLTPTRSYLGPKAFALLPLL